MQNVSRFSFFIVLILTLIFASGPLSAKPVQLAQLSIEIGGSSQSIVRSLENAGYSEVQITKSGFSSIRAQACFKGGRYSLKINRFSGQIKRGAKIGECRPVLGPKGVAAKLRADGYRRISIDEGKGEGYNVVACTRGQRFRLRVNQYGDTLKRSKLGRCREKLDVAEITQRLRENRFNRVRLIKENGRQLVFEACSGLRRMRLRVRRDGKIERERRIGSCRPPINHWNIPGILAGKGFDRISVVDKKLPVYRAEACRRLKLIEVRLNRFGEIRKQTQIGDCNPPLNKAQVVKMIRQSGANRINVRVDSSGAFVATSCHRGKQVRSRFDKYGKLFDRNVIGKCAPPPHLGKILRGFGERNLADMQVYVEGCRKGRRVRIEIDRYGEVIDRKRIGRCK